jgi:hypothetical protein
MIEVRLHNNQIDEIVSQDMPTHLEKLSDDVFWLGLGHGESLRSFLICIENGKLVCKKQ